MLTPADRGRPAVCRKRPAGTSSGWAWRARCWQQAVDQGLGGGDLTVVTRALEQLAP
jgi:hypothetical protein